MDKGDAMVKHSLGARVDDMYEIQLLATNPAAQGRGLGSALVQYILDKVAFKFTRRCRSPSR